MNEREEPDYYAILQVDPRAEKEVIEAAYRRLAVKYHPDRDPSSGATERMRQINAAYEVLSDSERRRSHDLHREARQTSSPALRQRGRRRSYPLWLLAGILVLLAVVTRVNPRLLLYAIPLVLAIWFIWKWSD